MNVTLAMTKVAISKVVEVVRHLHWLSLALSCGIHALPAVLFLALMIVCSQGEYYSMLFALVGCVFLIASILVGMTLWRQHEICMSQKKLFQRLFLRSSVAWSVAIGALACLSVTPLYLGAYNGDGTNGLAECIVMVILFAFTFSPSVLALGAATAYVSSYLFLCAKDKTPPPTQLQPTTK